MSFSMVPLLAHSPHVPEKGAQRAAGGARIVPRSTPPPARDCRAHPAPREQRRLRRRPRARRVALARGLLVTAAAEAKHEAAHVFHNCKGHTAGLSETRTKEWLLFLEFRKRETFAYACEGFAAIVERVSSKAERLAMADKFAKQFERYGYGDFEPTELASIVQEACEDRSGWKVILTRCAREKRSRKRSAAVSTIGG